MNLDDHYDSLTLANEHLLKAASMFRAIVVLMESDAPDSLEDARRIARHAHDDADLAADEFGTTAAFIKLEMREGQS